MFISWLNKSLSRSKIARPTLPWAANPGQNGDLAIPLEQKLDVPSLDIINITPQPILEDITVVIPTLGRLMVTESLHWIAAGSAWPGGLIVVDQGANPVVADWLAMLRSIGINAEYVPSSQRGRAAGLNRGLECVRTQFVALTDDDCFVDADWLKTLMMYLRHNPESIVTGRVEPAGNGAVMAVTSLTSAVYRRPRLKFDAMSGGNMGTSLSVVQRIGFFDEDARLRTAEDGEWAYRALRAGTPIIYAPDVVVRHFGWRDESERAVQYQDYARSHGGFYGKYLRKGDWFIALRVLIHLGRALRRWLRGLLTGDQELVLNGRAYVTGLLPGIIAGLQRRRQL